MGETGKMKRSKIELKINVPDDFYTGNCKNCPMRSIQSGESFPGCYWEKIECKLGFNKEVCPIEMETGYRQGVANTVGL